MTDEYMAEGLSASERAELVLFGMERGSHRPDGEEKDLYAITKASLVRAIEAAERDARASACRYCGVAANRDCAKRRHPYSSVPRARRNPRHQYDQPACGGPLVR